mgnify:CR=1 FL=1
MFSLDNPHLAHTNTHTLLCVVTCHWLNPRSNRSFMFYYPFLNLITINKRMIFIVPVTQIQLVAHGLTRRVPKPTDWTKTESYSLIFLQSTKILYLGIAEPHLLGLPPYRAIYKFYKRIAREFVDNFYKYMYIINTQCCLLGITNRKKDTKVNLK